MLGDAAQRALALLEHDGNAALDGAVAEAVAHDERAAALDELGEVGVVVLRASQYDLAAEFLLQVGLAGLELLGRLAQIREDEVLRADEGDELDHMELIARDRGVVQLAVVADLVDQTADLVVLLDGLADRVVGDVDAEVLVQRLEHVGAQLGLKVLIAVFRVFEGNVGEFAEEIIVVDDTHVLDGVEVLLLEMLLEAAGGGAGLGPHLGVEEIVAALERALHQGTGIVADAAGQIVGRDVGRGAARRSQSDREAAGQVEKDFRHEVAGIADGALPVGLALLDELIVRLLKQVLKIDEML